MSMTDPLADMLSRIRNGQQARHIEVSSPFSKLRESVLAVLKKEGFIQNYKKLDGDKPSLSIELRYVDGQGVIKTLKRVSTPGRRHYSDIRSLPKYFNGLGVYILSTPKGVMSDFEARKQHVGGEVLCAVF